MASEWNATNLVALEEAVPSSKQIGKRRASNPSPTPDDTPVDHAPPSFSSAFSARPKKKVNTGISSAVTTRGRARKFAPEFPFGEAALEASTSGRGSTSAVSSGTSSGLPAGVGVGGVASTSTSAANGGASTSTSAGRSLNDAEQTGLDASPEQHHNDLIVDDLPRRRTARVRKPRVISEIPKDKKRKGPAKPEVKKLVPFSKMPVLKDVLEAAARVKEEKAERKAAAKARALARRSRKEVVIPGVDKEVEKEERRKAKMAIFVARQSISKPLIPAILTAPGERSEEAKAMLGRAREPEVARNLAKALESQREQLHVAYSALNDELIKLQIEGAVIRNVQNIVLVGRSALFSPAHQPNYFSLRQTERQRLRPQAPSESYVFEP
ncbi:hypothetical protein P7C70_g1129, partial [Phenoliferia sp. Uapishka_3]